MTHKQFATALILVLAVISSLGDGSAQQIKMWAEMQETQLEADSGAVYGEELCEMLDYVANAESLKVRICLDSLDSKPVLIECANGANWPSSGGVLQKEGEK